MKSAPVVVLLSIGCHPASLRSRRAERDARAMTLALATGLPVIGLHVGTPCQALQAYLGMGPAELVVLPERAGQDPVAALVAWLECHPAVLILCGHQAEQGECTGLLPHMVAHALGLALVPAVVELRCDDHALTLTQALPGARRRLSCAQTVVATVDRQAQAIAPVARGPALRRRCTMNEIDKLPSVALLAAPVIETRAARPRPRRIGPVAMDGVSSVKAPRQHLTADEAATTIINFLVREGVIEAPTTDDLPSGDFKRVR